MNGEFLVLKKVLTLMSLPHKFTSGMKEKVLAPMSCPHKIVSGILLISAVGLAVDLRFYPPKDELSGYNQTVPPNLTRADNNYLENLLTKRIDEYRKDLEAFSANLR